MRFDGEALRRARQAANLNQTELARIIGVTPPTIRRWEHGGDPNAFKIWPTAEVLGIPIDTLFTESPQEATL